MKLTSIASNRVNEGSSDYPNGSGDSLDTNRCFAVKAMGKLVNAGTSWEECNTG
jgi:hypothetical protein